MTRPDERGIVRPGQPAADAAAPTPEHVLAGLALIRDGRMFRLARDRFPKMPLFPGHPTFEVRLLPHAAGHPRARATSRGGRPTTRASAT